jgi:hypothetical protein
LLVVAGIALFAVVIWFGAVSPERSKADTLDSKITAAKSQLHVAQVLNSVEQTRKGKKSGLTLLQIAMPEALQMPSVIRQVQTLANGSNVNIQSFGPSAPTPMAGYDVVPISLSVQGRYGSVESFLRGLRLQAGTRAGKIHAAGRLFDVDSVSLSPGGTGANELGATIQLSVFVYTGTTPPPPATTTTTDTTGG